MADTPLSGIVVDFMQGFIFVSVYFVPPIFSAVGLVGNYLSLVLMNNPKYKTSTTCYYMRFLSFGDSMGISSIMIQYLQIFTGGVILKNGKRREYCYFYRTVTMFCTCISPWILVVMAADRFTAVRWPLRAKSLCTIKRARILTAVIFLIATTWAILVNFRNVLDEGSSHFCPYIWSRGLPYYWANTTYISYIPMTILVVLNAGVAIVVQKGRKDRDAMTEIENRRGRSKAESSITKMMVLVCMTFVSSVIPLQIHFGCWRYWTGEVTEMTRLARQFSLLFTVRLYAVNYSVNFYIYVMGCKQFRLELRGYISRCISMRGQN
jgi:hypothetical protein